MIDRTRGRYLRTGLALLMLAGLGGCAGLVKDPQAEQAQALQARMELAQALHAEGERAQAYQQYLEILSETDEHPQANAAARALLQEQLNEARNALQQGNLIRAQQSLDTYQRMASALPGYVSQAPSVQQDIQQQKQAQARQARLTELHAEAEQAEQAGNLTQAAHVYRQILNEDGANVEALTGQKRLIERQESLVSQSLDARRFNEAEQRLATLRELSIGLDQDNMIGRLERRLTQLRAAQAAQTRAQRAAQAQAQATPVPTPSPTPAPVSAEPSQAERIAAQMQRAQQLEQAGERTQAYGEYLDILAQDATHGPAQEGAQRLLEAKAWMVRSAIAQGELVQAESHLNLYRQMSASLPDYRSHAQALADEIVEAQRQAVAPVPLPEPVPEPIPEPIPTPAPELASPFVPEPIATPEPPPAVRAQAVERPQDALETVVDTQTVAAMTAEVMDSAESATPAVVVGERYLDHANGTVTDTQTGLHWMRCSLGQDWNGQRCEGSAQRLTFDQAKAALAAFNREGGFAGYRDWRLPTREELRSLIYCSTGQPQTWNNSGEPCEGNYQRPTIHAEVFPNTPAWNFWTSSAYDASNMPAWEVNFYLGRDGWEREDGGDTRVRLVR